MIHSSAVARLSADEARKFAQLLLKWADLSEDLAEKQAKEPYNDVITTGSGSVFLRQGARFSHYSPTEAKYIGDLLIQTSDTAKKGPLGLAECPEAHERNLGPREVVATTTGVCLREGDSYESYSFGDAQELGELLIRGAEVGKAASRRETERTKATGYRAKTRTHIRGDYARAGSLTIRAEKRSDALLRSP
jgi:hypothetical protein